MKIPAEKYLALRAETDRLCRALEKAHSCHLECRAGCNQCCMNFSILPVEFYSMAAELISGNTEINTDAGDEQCIFLVNGLCSIYSSRPIICRTHGLPLLSMGEEEWELSYCELNFRNSPPHFDDSNTFPSDKFNSRLFMLNREFIKDFGERRFSESDLLPLRDLVTLLPR